METLAEMKDAWGNPLFEYIVTFGAGQVHQNCFIRVRACDEMEVRRFMKAHFDNKYSHIYESEDAAGVERFNLREIK